MKFGSNAVQNGSKHDQRRAVTYSRSATMQIGQSLQALVADDVARARTWADAEGIQLTQTFADGPASGRSAASDPGFGAMLQAAEQGEFEILIVRDLTRIKPNSAAVGSWIREFEGLGVAIWQMDVGRFVDQADLIRLMMNEQQSARHSLLTRKGIEAAKARPKKHPFDTALETLAAIDHPPGWDVLANVRYSAAFTYDHSLELKTFIVYGRDADDSRDGADLEDGDIRRCLKLGHGQGWRCVGTYADLGVTDPGEIGPALTKLLARVCRGDINYVIVSELSQLSCDARAIQVVTDKLVVSSCELLIAHEPAC